jgi:phage shock protein A
MLSSPLAMSAEPSTRDERAQLTYKDAMGILNRISTLVKSNLNAAIDKMSDPGKEIDQLVLEMEQQLRAAREEVRQTMVLEKRERQRVEKLTKASDEWSGRAEQAVRASDDPLARAALERKLAVDAERAEAEASVKEQGAYVDQLTVALKALEQRVKEVKARKETLKTVARVKSGRGGGIGSTSAFEQYDQLQTSVDVAEAEVALTDELAAASHEDAHSRSVENQLADLEHKGELDDRLAALKAKMQHKKTEE